VGKTVHAPHYPIVGAVNGMVSSNADNDKSIRAQPMKHAPG
jgi:hypothetical protein